MFQSIATIVSKFFKVYQNLVTSYFLDFLPGHFLQCEDTFMDDYDGIYIFNDLKYGTYEIFDIF
jgi:hypothetical protein